RLTAPERGQLAALAQIRCCIASADSADALAGLGWPTLVIGGFIDRADSAAPAAIESRPVGAACGVLLPSSGSTGPPKLVFRSADALAAVAATLCEALHLIPGDRILACAPLCHSYGMELGFLAPVFAGCEVRLMEGFDPSTVVQELGQGVTLFPGVPFMFELLA